jgi:hypothetical protein
MRGAVSEDGLMPRLAREEKAAMEKSNHRELLLSKSDGGERYGNVRA